jgi:hypothetical protein
MAGSIAQIADAAFRAIPTSISIRQWGPQTGQQGWRIRYPRSSRKQNPGRHSQCARACVPAVRNWWTPAIAKSTGRPNTAAVLRRADMTRCGNDSARGSCADIRSAPTAASNPRRKCTTSGSSGTIPNCGWWKATVWGCARRATRSGLRGANDREKY